MATVILLKIAVILLLAKAFGELCNHVHLPTLLGEILAGVILGPAVFGWIGSEPFLDIVAEIGIILAIFLAGYDHGDISELFKYKKTSFSLSLLSSFIPIIGVIFVAQSIGYGWVTTLFLAVALGATSIDVSLRSLKYVKETATRAGKTVIGSLITNDITGLLLLTGVATYGDIVLGATTTVTQEIIQSLGAIALCFAIFYIGIKTIPRLTHRFIQLRVEQAQFTLAVVIILVLAWFASTFGLSSIIGAFIAGLILSRSPVFETKTFHEKVRSISYGFFVPIFFVMLGTHLELTHLSANLSQALLLLAFILPTQLLTGYLVSYFSGYSGREGLIMGLGMLPYGEVTLVVMTALLEKTTAYSVPANIHELFSTVIVLKILTVILTPILMKTVNTVLHDDARPTTE